MSELNKEFNKSGLLTEKQLKLDESRLSEKSQGLLEIFSEKKQADKDILAAEIEDRRLDNIEKQVRSLENDSAPVLGGNVSYPPILPEQIEQLYDRTQNDGKTAAEIVPEDRAEHLIKLAWFAVEKDEQAKDELHKEKQFEERRSFVDKLMEIDEFNRGDQSRSLDDHERKR